MKASAGRAPLRSARFRAGCGRTCEGPAGLPELAYTELAYPECPACPHRLTPDGGPSFCRWLPQGAPHPFAALGALRAQLEP
ncbi:hypothetical protein [Truepera radiovictrix]|uniref:Uncharacterized protein n=1 Tax=Truepera radiovictrix (strain DSM 17093 / CIP 108686 / LMG 22925 / RQ-24) TaxID=649638 RepID=D7CUI6_TRURR|nr:hypothetical protein [Truepera radiovictrix]ADI15771.1 hypothetical protein Trad_2667 [Truepera radiovictrix DSM 17093]WMT58602.1 hypothetical protein RCV51_06565 [Truepera radiovictrix]